MKVVELWITLRPYGEITKLLGPGKTTISKIIKEACSREPELGDLKKLNAKLKADKLNVPEVRRANNLAEIMQTIGIDTARLEPALRFYENSGLGSRADGAIDAGLRMLKLEAEHNKTYNELLAEFGKLMESVGQLQKKENALKISIREQEKELEGLDVLRAIKAKADEYHIEVSELEKYIENGDKIQKLGFPPRTAELVAKELRKVKLTPVLAAARLAKLVEKGISLEESVSDKEVELGKMRREERKLLNTAKTLRGSINQDGITLKTLRHRVGQLQAMVRKEEEIHDNQKELLGAAYNAKRLALRVKHLELENELKVSHRKTIMQLEELKDEKIRQLKDAHSKTKGDLDKTIADLEGKKRILEEEIAALEEEKKLGEQARQGLGDIEKGLRTVRVFKTLLALAESPSTTKASPAVILDPYIAILGWLFSYISIAEVHLLRRADLRKSTSELTRLLMEEIKSAGRI